MLIFGVNVLVNILQKLGLEYEHYLKEVVAILESDENFRKKLEESNISDIKVMRQLEWASVDEALNQTDPISDLNFAKSCNPALCLSVCFASSACFGKLIRA